MGTQTKRLDSVKVNPCLCNPGRYDHVRMQNQRDDEADGIPQNYYIECPACKKLSGMSSTPTIAIEDWNKNNPVQETA